MSPFLTTYLGALVICAICTVIISKRVGFKRTAIFTCCVGAIPFLNIIMAVSTIATTICCDDAELRDLFAY